MPEHFAYFHTFSQMGGLNVARRVFGGATALDETLRSLNAHVFAAEDRLGEALASQVSNSP
jgi:type I restriction enzyme R subunit